MISPWYPHILMILLYLYILIISHKMGTTTNQLGVLRGPPRLLAGCRQPASDHWRILHPLSRVAEDVLIIYIYNIPILLGSSSSPYLEQNMKRVFFVCASGAQRFKHFSGRSPVSGKWTPPVRGAPVASPKESSSMRTFQRDRFIWWDTPW